MREEAEPHRTPQRLDHAAWMRRLEVEQHRFRELVAGLDAAEWRAPTVCEGWDVHAVVAHVAGAAQTAASPREMVRQAVRSRGLLPEGTGVDRINALQIAERADATPTQLLDELEEVDVRALRARSRLPRWLRALPVPFGPPLGTAPLGYLYGPIWTRDTWLHRLDLCDATDRTPVLTAEHDGAIVEDVVAEWAATHGRAYRLHLTGRAGGRFGRGHGGEELELDPVGFVWALSGRAAGEGLLATRVNF